MTADCFAKSANWTWRLRDDMFMFMFMFMFTYRLDRTGILVLDHTSVHTIMSRWS
jgi:hypothetical protein